MKPLPSLYRTAVWCASVFLALSITACQEYEADQPDVPAPVDFTAVDDQVDELLAQMTLAEKVGQMTQADQEFLDDPSDITEYHLGSLLSGGNSDPEAGNSMAQWTEMYERYQQYALETRLGIPLLYGVDAVHGHSNVEGAVIFPHNIGLGATRNADLVEEAARITAIEMRATGVQWNFAPAVSVPRDERWGRTYEGFSEDPELVSELGAAAVRGYQGSDLSDSLAVAATAKHYLGDGGTIPGTGIGLDGEGLDQGDMRVDTTTMRDVHLYPYRAAVDAGVASIMPSYSSWNGVKMSADEYLLTDVLKGELGFDGFLISDYRAVNQIYPDDYKASIEASINAGMDMVMVPDQYQRFIELLTELVEEERVPMERIDDAVRRILRVKFTMGLMGDASTHLMANEHLQEAFGSEEHRQVAREAVRQSLVLLENENDALPVAKDLSRIHVAGRGADDVGMQCGGWTIDWQGGMGAITDGTTILEAIRNTVSGETEVTYSQDGTGADGADVGVVVIGEEPYAEGVGDRLDLALSDEDVAAVQQVNEAGIPVVVILLSGRPMIVNDVLDQADAFVAAWLPGTEGQGVADVLFGDYAPTGKLSYTWPRSMDQIPLNVGDENYDPLFEFGYGLTY